MLQEVADRRLQQFEKKITSEKYHPEHTMLNYASTLTYVDDEVKMNKSSQRATAEPDSD